jgi:hypothetical protein
MEPLTVHPLQRSKEQGKVRHNFKSSVLTTLHNATSPTLQNEIRVPLAIFEEKILDSCREKRGKWKERKGS